MTVYTVRDPSTPPPPEVPPHNERREQLDKVQKAIGKGDVGNAVRALEEHLEKHPDDVDARMRLGQLLLRKGKLDEAWEWFVSAASGFAQKGFFDKAIALLHRAFELDPARPEPALMAAELQVKRGHAGDAKKTLVTARQRYRSSSKADRENALKVAEKRALLVPDVDAWIDVARLLVKLGRRAQSVAILDERAAHAEGKERKAYLKTRLLLNATPRSLWRFLRG
jgi:tetratricopeptide (TPR) repeat protein